MREINHQQNRVIRLMLIEDDPVFRSGFVTGLGQFSDLQVVLEAESAGLALRALTQQGGGSTTAALDAIVLSLDLGRYQTGQSTGLALCRQIRSRYPHLPILLLSAHPEPIVLAAALQVNAAGYCSKGTAISDLVAAIRQVAAGQPYWTEGMQLIARTLTAMQSREASPKPYRQGMLPQLRQRLHQSGRQQIDATIAAITEQLQSADLSLLDQVFLAGRRRELRAARWLVDRLLMSSTPSVSNDFTTENRSLPDSVAEPQAMESARSEMPNAGSSALVQSNSAMSLRSLQATLFDSISVRLQSTLHNLTETPLEIDILRQEKKRDLLYLILRKLEEILDDLRFSQVPLEQLAEKQSAILHDVWRNTTVDFFGRYYTLQLGDRSLELVDRLLQEGETVEAEILNKIPLVYELLAHLLFQVPLAVDDRVCAVGTVEAMARAEIVLQNLVIQVANAVVQPLLNRFGDVVVIKQNFYDKRLLSSREIERFRNNLSWRYRMNQYFGEPTAIFESRFTLFVLREGGITQCSIYAPRNQELANLSGVQYTVTLALEARDAIAPRVRSAISFVGSGVVYLLTEVIGRGIGLIGRGVIKGIGNALHETKVSRNSPRSR